MGLDPGAIKARLSELKNNAKSSVGSLNETNKTQTRLELKRKKQPNISKKKILRHLEVRRTTCSAEVRYIQVFNRRVPSIKKYLKLYQQIAIVTALLKHQRAADASAITFYATDSCIRSTVILKNKMQAKNRCEKSNSWKNSTFAKSLGRLTVTLKLSHQTKRTQE